MNKFYQYSLCALAINMVVSGVAAQPAADDQLERIQVTGSNIKRTTLESSIPVQVIGRAEIEQSGFTQLHQLLETLTVAGVGTFSTEGNDHDTTANGTAAISLRGLGPDATLVLINGRRATVSAFAENVINAFVDINTIPLSAIERVDILKDGASAIYGSDAVVGVVNVILRKDFNGTEITFSQGGTTGPSYDETSASLLWGTGNNDSHAMLILDYFRNTNLMRSEVGRFGSKYQVPYGGSDGRSSTGFPGTFVVNGVSIPDATCPAENIVNNACRFDDGPANSVLPEAERFGAIFQATQRLGNTTEAYLELALQHNTSNAYGSATPFFPAAGLTALADHPNNPFGTDISISRYRTEDAGPRTWHIESDTFRLVAGLQGSIKQWDWDLSLQRGKSKSTQFGGKDDGWVRLDYLQQAIDSGQYNPFGSTYNDPEVINTITTTLTRQAESRLTSYNASISGEAFRFGQRAVAMAAGMEYREEEAFDRPDEQFIQGLIIGTEAVTAEAAREIYAAYLEFLIPLTDDIELTLAGRHDDYSDAGSSTNPKVSFAWRPGNNLLLRTSYSQGFRAPSLAQIGLGASQDSPQVDDYYRCASDGICEGSRVRTVIFSGNPNLEAETSESWNVGAVWQINPALHLSVDIWDITHKNKIDRYPVENLYADECNNQNSSICQRFDALAGETLGEIYRIYNTFVNLASQKANGIDLNTGYTLDLAANGLLTFGLDWSYINKFEKDGLDYTGEYNYPQHRGRFTTDWSLGRWGVTTTVKYIGSFENEQALSVMESVTAPKVASQTLVDLQGRYNLNTKTRITLGINNLFDRDPPFADSLYGYASAIHRLRGQYLYGKISYRF